MAKINTYEIDNIISDKDIVIGSDGDNLSQTKNYNVSDLRQYVLSGLTPDIGGNLKITTITETSNVYLTPESWINNQDPAIEVLQYEIIFLILNGRTYIFRKNNAKYGVGETQALSSDFTEIDITSVINANLQGLDSVLEQGNESFDKNAKINSLYLWDNYNNDDYGVIVYGDKDRVNFKKTNGSLIGTLGIGQLQVYTSGAGYFALSFPSVSTLRQVDFQNASGTVAYLSDIPDVNIVSISAGDNVSVTEVSPKNFEISATIPESLYLQETYLIDSITDTIHYNNGGFFEYNETTSPIDSISLQFSNSVSFVDDIPIFARIRFHYEDGKNNRLEIAKEPSYINGNSISFPVDFSDYYNLDTPGVRISFFEIQIYPGQLKSTSTGIPFDGATSSAVCVYFREF
jgi:hypothetical protein